MSHDDDIRIPHLHLISQYSQYLVVVHLYGVEHVVLCIIQESLVLLIRKVCVDLMVAVVINPFYH